MEWLPGQQSLVELCGPEGLIISLSLAWKAPEFASWETKVGNRKQKMAGERMSNYKWQAPAPNMQLLFKQAIYNPLDGACREWGLCSLGVVWAQSTRKGSIRLPLSWESPRNRCWGADSSERTAKGSQDPFPDLPFALMLLQEPSSSLTWPRPPCPAPSHAFTYSPLPPFSPGPQLTFHPPDCPVRLLSKTLDTLPFWH